MSERLSVPIISLRVLVTAPLRHKLEKITLENTTRSTLYTDASRPMMPQRSGGLEDSKYILHTLKTTQANCQARCEMTNRPTTDTRLANRALVGPSFKNFTVNKPYDCHLLCFVEKCRCQAYQMKGKNSCELLDEDRFAAPDDFVEDREYEYYDISREYEKALRYYDTINLRIT